MKTELGGDRLGSGNKQEISLRNYERSSHDLGYIWRSSMASGTLVPFMSEVGLPGDSFDIDLDCDVKTLPTVGPLFGSYKVQLDVFECPIRLYQGKLHMNMLNIGMDMSEVLLPQVDMIAQYESNDDDNSQINSSSIYSYLNMRGLGRTSDGSSGIVRRYYNAIPYLGYWDIYKNYYANKQEERGFVIHAANQTVGYTFNDALVTVDGIASGSGPTDVLGSAQDINTEVQSSGGAEPLVERPIVTLRIDCSFAGVGEAIGEPDVSQIQVEIDGTAYNIVDVFENVTVYGPNELFTNDASTYISCSGYTGVAEDVQWEVTQTEVGNTINTSGEPQLTEFPLDNIDDMRMDILEAVRQATAFEIGQGSAAPYGLGLGKPGATWTEAFKLSSQEGLGIKTYQSDLFNNWISTEWIDGTNGVNEVTAVSTAGNEFTIDALNLANKVYNMLNRIAISGGSYDDWLDAVYTHERSKSCESPVYHGSLIKELAFEEVVSMSDVEVAGEAQPLGTLAGRGRLTGKNKGGKIKIKVSEPSYIIGIASLTPRIDYSQGNKWDVNLKNMNDFHKPALDEIGFQDLVTDQLAWFDTVCDGSGNVTYSSAGKQPAWINYMTNVNQTRGSFAEVVGEGGNENASMFMTLNRRYEQGTSGIDDLTTYVDPSKYNEIFAQTALDSQNFWVQISNRIIARRKMSAKVIPNL
jgi:hypothetical protein